MENFYLFEAGATKTSFFEVNGNSIKDTILPPFNPNRNFKEFESYIKNIIELESNSIIYFYGSGLGSDENKERTEKLFKQFNPKYFGVFDDILGAARATLKNEPGIVCILGTGGLAAYFDGEKIIKRRGGYGYLIDDLGGGLELGKRFLSLWLNGDLSQRANDILKEKLGINSSTFIKEFYNSPDLELIASLPPFVLQFEDEPMVKLMISEYFKNFVDRNLMPLAKEYNSMEFNCVGSIGFLFQRHINEILMSKGVAPGLVIQHPANGLVTFHKNN